MIIELNGAEFVRTLSVFHPASLHPQTQNLIKNTSNKKSELCGLIEILYVRSYVCTKAEWMPSRQRKWNLNRPELPLRTSPRRTLSFDLLFLLALLTCGIASLCITSERALAAWGKLVLPFEPLGIHNPGRVSSPLSIHTKLPTNRAELLAVGWREMIVYCSHFDTENVYTRLKMLRRSNAFTSRLYSPLWYTRLYSTMLH